MFKFHKYIIINVGVSFRQPVDEIFRLQVVKIKIYLEEFYDD